MPKMAILIVKTQCFMPKMAILTVKRQYSEGNTKDLYVETMRPGRADFYFAEAKCKSRVSRKEVPYRAPKVSRNDPKTTLLTRTPWPRKILEIFPRRACLSDLCLNVQIVCFSFKLQRVCTLRATILLYPCLNVQILCFSLKTQRACMLRPTTHIPVCLFICISFKIQWICMRGL